MARVLNLLLWVILAIPMTALGQDYILERSFWTDPSGDSTIEQAMQASYKPYTGVLSQGFNAHAQWVRLTIGEVPANGPQQLALRIRPVFLDEIILYDPADPRYLEGRRKAGDLTPWGAGELNSIHHGFVIPTQARPREVWLRLKTTSTQMMHVEALSLSEMQRDEFTLGLMYEVLLSVIVAFLVWVLLAWVRDRDYLNGLFVLRQSLLLLYTASFFGVHRVLLSPWLEPAQLNAVYSWLVMLASAVSLYFEYRFLSEYQMPRWGHATYGGVALLSVGAMGLYVMGYPMHGLRLNTLFIAAGIAYMTVIAWCIRDRYTPEDKAKQASGAVIYKLPKSVIVSYNTLVLIVLALSVLPGLGALRGGVMSIYGVSLYGLISCILMSCLLIVRSRERERMQQEVTNHLFLSREQLALEQQRRQDQSQLLSMLMHELKTPLSIIDMAVSTRGNDGRTTDFVHRAVSSITGILDRCIQTDRIAEVEFKLQHQTVHLSDQLTQWLTERKEGAERIAAHITPGLAMTTDAQCVRIIANNLIENALRHGHPSEPVQVSLTSQAGLLLRVSNLPGPSGRPDPEQLFSKYYRSTAAQSKSGTGLGLYLSHKLANKLGGTLRYRPDDRYITFELWLPISASS